MMDLQYIYDNSTTPPTQSVLQYKVDPDSVYASTDAAQKMMVDLSITVFNPTTAAVSCQSFQFGIYVGTTESAQLASTSDGVQLTTHQSQWSTNSAAAKAGDLYWYTANPASGVASEPLASLGSFTFQLMSIPINEIEGATQFMILEMTGADPKNPNSVQGPLSLTKEQGGLKIEPGSFTVTLPSVSPNTEVNLSWDVVGSDHWLVRDHTSGKTIYDSIADPPAQMQCQDLPIQTTTYELIAYAGQTFTTALADVEVTNPHFLEDFPPVANPPSVDSGTASTLSWKTAYAQYVIVTADGGYSSGKIDSSSGSAQLQVNPSLTTNYTVTTFGADGTSGEALQVTVSVNPPSVKSLTATPESFARGQSVTLSWEVKSATSVVLNQGQPDEVTFTFPPVVTSTQVSPVARVTYKLTAQGQGPPAQSQPVTVIQQLESYSLGAVFAQALACDGTYIWGADESGQVIRLRISDGTLQGPFPVGSGPRGMAYDGTYIWVGNNSQVTRLSATDGSNQGSFLSGYTALCLACDGTHVWVGGNDDDTLQVWSLLASNGSVQWTTNTDDFPSALVYDGTYVWVVTGDDTVTRLLASDGSNQGTFQLGDSGAMCLAYDGTNIWVGTDGGVCWLNPTNGNILGTFGGDTPATLLYDGTTYLWVQFANSIVRLRVADASNQGSFFAGSNWAFALAKDDTSIWVAISGPDVIRIRFSDWPPPLGNA